MTIAWKVNPPENAVAYWAIRNGIGQWSIIRPPRFPGRANYVIVCDRGDWSGFRRFHECFQQDLHKNEPTDDWKYWIEER